MLPGAARPRFEGGGEFSDDNPLPGNRATEGDEILKPRPREHRIDRRRFQLLKRTHVEARYSTAYEISVEGSKRACASFFIPA